MRKMANVLVTYFSASGVTKKLGERLADAIGAASYEICPAVAYTSADLDWRNQQSRSSLEMSDRSSRPALADADAPIADADIILVGFPVWWYREPSIIDTFMEAYDFTGKTVVPFATSGMSPIGESGANMAKLAPGARVLEGERLEARASAQTLKSWYEGLAL